MDMRKTIAVVFAAALAAAPAIAANDSTSVEEVDVPWKAPSYAESSGYADNAGQLGGRNLNWVRNNGLYSADAGSVDASGITGMPSCSSGYVLKKTATGFTCVNRVSGADVAYSVDAADITGIANCANGYVLKKVAGGFTCVDTIANATNGGGGNDVITVTMSGKKWEIERQFTYTPAFGSPSTTSVGTYTVESVCPDAWLPDHTGVCTVLQMGNGLHMLVAPSQPSYTNCGSFDNAQNMVEALPSTMNTRTAIAIGCLNSSLRGYATRIQ